MAKLIHFGFSIYTLLIIARIIGSWFPEYANHPWMKNVAGLVDPYLDIFRTFIPPIGGTLDVSPVVALFALSILRSLLVNLFR